MGELAHEVRLLGGQARAREDGESIPAVLRLDAIDLSGDPRDGSLVGK